MKSSESSQAHLLSTIRFAALGLVCLALLAPLVAYGRGGTFMRYSGDDYCYASALVENGLIGNQVESYFHVAQFNGNRFSLTLFINLANLLGSTSGAIMPALAILAWLAGTVLLAREISKRVLMKPAWLVPLAAAAGFIFLCLYQAPTLLQVLYWLTGMLAYLAPVIGLTWLIAFILRNLRLNKLTPFNLAGIGILAFLNAGFTETGAALQATWLLAGMGAFWLTGKKDPIGRKRSLLMIGVPLIMTVVAMVFLALSPSNADRIHDYPHPDMVNLIRISFASAGAFIFESLKGYPLPSFVTLLCFTTLSMELVLPEWLERLTIRRWLLISLLVVILTICLVAATAAPTAWARSAYPEQRAWMPGRVVMTAGLALLGALSGGAFRRAFKLSDTVRQAIFIIGMLAVSAYAIRTVPRIVAETRPMQSWAAGWDARDRTIRSAIAAGETDLVVDSLPMIIPYVGELQHDPDYWYNHCAASWYGVHTISAESYP